MQKGHQVGLLTPGFRDDAFCFRRAHGQRTGFSFEVGLGVEVGGGERNVTQPSTHGIDVGTGTEQMSCCGVANHVRADSLRGKRR